jgi:hypothetical protein
MSAIRTTLSFAILAATAGLMLVATADTSFARGGPQHNGRPLCGGDCQANKAKPPTTVTNGKIKPGVIGGANNGGKNYKQQ